MTTYVPDTWVMLEFTRNGEAFAKKVFAGWYGGFANGDSWKLSSGVVSIEDRDDYWEVVNASGSIYKCNKRAMGMSSYQMSILNQWKKDIAANMPDNEILILATV